MLLLLHQLLANIIICTLGQSNYSIKKNLGFYTVIEAALGADMVANSEAKELKEKDF